MFTVFFLEALSCVGPGQLPTLPSLKSGLALNGSRRDQLRLTGRRDVDPTSTAAL